MVKVFNKSVVIALAVALLVMTGFAIGAGSGKGRPTAVGVVDVQKVFNSLAEKVQIDADIQTRADRIKQEDQERGKKIEELKKDLDDLAKPGTPAYQQKVDDLEKQSFELQNWRAFQTQKLQREQALQYEGLYRKMLDSIANYSKDHAFDVVMFKEVTPNLSNIKPEQLATTIQLRKVLYAAEDLDITDPLVQKMNNDFRNMTNAPKPTTTKP